jgi:hypothetical protein
MSITSILAAICQLQPSYSSANTPEMQERGRLVRGELAGEIRDRIPFFQSAFDSVFDDLAVEASDGIGRKTEAPWVRLFSRAMSPNPREGFYVVLHFAADGGHVFITVGCGSTIWSGGDLRSIPDDQLVARTTWARSVVQQRYKALAPFTDQIVLGAKASLPKTFEKATAIAKKIAVGELADADVDRLLYEAAERLGEIYLAQLDQRDVSPGAMDTEEVIAIAKPLRQTRRQGRGLSAAERRAVELRAMSLAVDYLTAQGFDCEDTSATSPYDLLARRADKALMIEVKGTTSDLCDSVLMTKNEVELHRREKGSTGLLIVSKIRLDRSGRDITVEGGEVEALLDWDIDRWIAEPIAYQLTRGALAKSSP